MLKKILIVVLSCFMTILATGCNAFVPANDFKLLQEDYDRMVERSAEQKVQLQELEAKLEAASESKTEPTQPDATERLLLEDLEKNAPVILAEFEAEGDLQLIPARCKVLGEKYVYAFVEDGQAGVDLLLRYRLEAETDTIEWQLAIWDAGEGWQISKEDAASQAEAASQKEETADADTSKAAQASEPSVSQAGPEITDEQQEKYKDILEKLS